ncbi:alpha/beta fold hydrolase [Nocardia terpenica]|uniref:Alpha/beta fold hydrolase n=1 Tax=Nocardia terpenica TaxID=455432 RepID=A0A6G9ZBP8_9NOCA|nr:alpha/beta fold hydrolase [Nocardia terpenica]
MATREITRGAMEFDVDGMGAPACLVHQYRQVSTRQPIAEALLPRLRVHAVNPVGFDLETTDTDLGMTAFADDLAEFHTAGAIPPWVMVGGSTGGMVALLHALRHPQRMRGLILVGTAASRRFTTGSLADPAHPRAAEAAAAHALLARGPEGAAAYRTAMFQLGVADPTHTPPHHQTATAPPPPPITVFPNRTRQLRPRTPTGLDQLPDPGTGRQTRPPMPTTQQRTNRSSDSGGAARRIRPQRALSVFGGGGAI